MLSGKETPLQPPQPLDDTQFKKRLDADAALNLITLAPLFTALNNEPESY